jgi:hypothetical protein
LLHPSRRPQIANNKVILVDTIFDLWPLIHDQMFVCIHLYFSRDQLLTTARVKGPLSPHEVISYQQESS